MATTANITFLVLVALLNVLDYLKTGIWFFE